MRAKKIIITIISVLAVIGITIGASNAFDVKAKTTYEDIEKFPESYKEALYALKEKHPNWTFEVMDTGLNWSEVVYNEMNPSNRSLVPTYFDSKFVGAYTAMDGHVQHRRRLSTILIHETGLLKITYSSSRSLHLMMMLSVLRQSRRYYRIHSCLAAYRVMPRIIMKRWD